MDHGRLRCTRCERGGVPLPVPCATRKPLCLFSSPCQEWPGGHRSAMRRASSSPFLTTPYNERMTSSIETLPSLFDMTQPWWDKVSYLLAPDGVVDQEVVDLWLERALRGSLSWKWEEDIIPLLQAVLLRTEGEKAEETFHVYWEHLRDRSQAVNTECVFDSFSFLQALATTKPDTLRKWAGSLHLVDTV